MHPFVSVIIPVFNAEAFLERCLDSVLAQTLTNIEVICVDDASQDKSLDILLEYAQRDPRVRVATLETNQGESYARNHALALATGEYIGSLDNDDAIEPDFFDRLYTKAKETDVDIVKCNFYEYGYDGTRKIIIINEVLGKDSFNLFAWWTGIFRRSFLIYNAITFPEGMILGGDVVFVTKSILCANMVECLDYIGYHYYRRENSGNSKALSFKKFLSQLTMHEQVIEYINFMSERGLPAHTYNKAFYRFFIGCLLSYAINLDASPEEKNVAFQSLSALLLRLYGSYSLHGDFSELLKKFYPAFFAVLESKDVDALAAYLQHEIRDTSSAMRVKLLRRAIRAQQSSSAQGEEGDILEPLVSIVVPVYNTKDFLPKCLASLVGQTLKNMEIICVDDASTDGSLGVLEDFCRKDSRVRVIRHKGNKGESAARNTGIAHAKGQYVGFVDSDDFVDLDFYEKLYAKALSGDMDIAKGIMCDETCDTVTPQHVINKKIMTNKFAFATFFSTAIYKRSFLDERNIKFPTELTNCPDIFFLLKAVTCAQSIVTSNDVQYHYRFRENSASRNLTTRKALSVLLSSEMIVDYLNSVPSNILPEDDYIFLFSDKYFFLYDLVYHVSFVDSEERTRFSYSLAKTLCNIFFQSKYEEQLHSILQQKQPIFYQAIRDNDQDRVAKLYIRFESRSALMAASLRSRLLLPK